MNTSISIHQIGSFRKTLCLPERISQRISVENHQRGFMYAFLLQRFDGCLYQQASESLSPVFGGDGGMVNKSPSAVMACENHTCEIILLLRHKIKQEYLKG